VVDPATTETIVHEQAAPAPEAPATEAVQAAVPAEPQYRRERRCQEVEVTGRRMPQRVCQNVMVLVEPGETAAE